MTDKADKVHPVVEGLPDGWRVYYLGRPAPYCLWVAQLEKKDPSAFDDITFVSRSGRTSEEAMAEAKAVLKTELGLEG